MIPVVCIELLFDGSSAEEKIENIADEGFRHIEFWSWRTKDIPAIQKVCKKRHITVANFSGHRLGNMIDEKTHEILLDDYRHALEAARVLQTKNLMFLTNELNDDGLVTRPNETVPDEAKRDAVVTCLGKAVEITPDDVTLNLELLNTALDHGGYYLKDLGTATEIVKRVGSPKLKILCDLYHQGMMGDDLIQLVREYKDHIGYYHVADIPGRHEPGTGNVHWAEILKEIKHSGYEGYVGFEYSPKNDSSESLRHIRDLWSSF